MSVKLKTAFAESTLWWKRLIKATSWQVISLVACFWLVAIPCNYARNQAGIHLFNLPGATHLSSGAWLDAGLPPLQAVRRPTGGRLHAGATNPVRPCFCFSAEPPADDSDLADDSQSGSDDLMLTGVELSPRAVEWRLSRSDAHRANSFINSKTKPPP